MVLSSLATIFLPCFQHSGKSGYGFSKVIHDILVGAHHTKLFLNKMFLLNAVLQYVRFMVYVDFFLNLGFRYIALYSSLDMDKLTGIISVKEKILALQYMLMSPAGPPSITLKLNVGSAAQAGFTHRALA